MTGLVMEQFTHLVSAKVWHNIFLVLITFLLSYVVLVFGILLPKRLAAKRGQKLAFRMSGLLEVFWYVFSGSIQMRRRWKSARKRYGKWQMPEAKKV